MSEFNFKDFILEELPGQENAPAKPKTTSNIKYEVEWVDGADFIISKKTSRTTSYMCFIINKKQIYIKSAKGEIKELTGSSYSRFLKDLDSTEIEVNASWVRFLNKTQLTDYLIDLMKNDEFIFAVNNNIINLDYIDELENGTIKQTIENIPKTKPARKITKYIYDKINELKTLNTDNKQLEIFDFLFKTITINEDEDNIEKYEKFFKDNNITHTCEFRNWAYQTNTLDILTFILGTNNIINMINNITDNILNNIIVPEDNWYYNNLEKLVTTLINYEFKPETISNYISTEYVKQKYTFKSFTEDYADTIKMQMDIYNKIKDKYPKNLAELHHDLSYMSIIKQNLEEIEKRKENNITLQQISESLKEYLFSDDTYTITTPSTIEEILDEADMQHNCLANYITKAVTQKCNLFFMRYNKTPDKSLVTIEVADNRIVQIKGSCNRDLNDNEKQFVNKWAKNKNLSM